MGGNRLDAISKQIGDIKARIRDFQLRNHMSPSKVCKQRAAHTTSRPVGSMDSLMSRTRDVSPLSPPQRDRILGECLYSPLNYSPSLKYPKSSKEILQKLKAVSTSAQTSEDLPHDFLVDVLQRKRKNAMPSAPAGPGSASSPSLHRVRLPGLQSEEKAPRKASRGRPAARVNPVPGARAPKQQAVSKAALGRKSKESSLASDSTFDGDYDFLFDGDAKPLGEIGRRAATTAVAEVVRADEGKPASLEDPADDYDDAFEDTAARPGLVSDDAAVASSAPSAPEEADYGDADFEEDAYAEDELEDRGSSIAREASVRSTESSVALEKPDESEAGLSFSRPASKGPSTDLDQERSAAGLRSLGDSADASATLESSKLLGEIEITAATKEVVVRADEGKPASLEDPADDYDDAFEDTAARPGLASTASSAPSAPEEVDYGDADFEEDAYAEDAFEDRGSSIAREASVLSAESSVALEKPDESDAGLSFSRPASKGPSTDLDQERSVAGLRSSGDSADASATLESSKLLGEIEVTAATKEVVVRADEGKPASLEDPAEDYDDAFEDTAARPGLASTASSAPASKSAPEEADYGDADFEEDAYAEDAFEDRGSSIAREASVLSAESSVALEKPDESDAGLSFSRPASKGPSTDLDQERSVAGLRSSGDSADPSAKLEVTVPVDPAEEFSSMSGVYRAESLSEADGSVNATEEQSVVVVVQERRHSATEASVAEKRVEAAAATAILDAGSVQEEGYDEETFEGDDVVEPLPPRRPSRQLSARGLAKAPSSERGANMSVSLGLDIREYITDDTEYEESAVSPTVQEDCSNRFSSEKYTRSLDTFIETQKSGILEKKQSMIERKNSSPTHSSRDLMDSKKSESKDKDSSDKGSTESFC